MKFTIRLVILGLGLVNGMTTGSADVIVDGQVIQEADISEISIDPISGDVTVAAGGLYTVTRDGEPPGGPQVVINSLIASSNTVIEGQSITISWTTTDADSCTPSGGDGGWSSQLIGLPNGTSDTLTLTTPGTYAFNLSCTNATPSSASRSVSVQVDAIVVPNDCQTPTLAGFEKTWFDHFRQQWPAPTYSEVITPIRTAGYLAIEFNTGSVIEDGGIAALTHTSTNGERFGAISECPGDFSERLPDTASRCTKLWFIGGSIKWNTEAGDQFGECNLEPDTTYYLNLTFTDGVDPATDRCEGTSNCRTIVRVWK